MGPNISHENALSSTPWSEYCYGVRIPTNYGIKLRLSRTWLEKILLFGRLSSAALCKWTNWGMTPIKTSPAQRLPDWELTPLDPVQHNTRISLFNICSGEVS